MPKSPPPASPESNALRWQLIRDLAVFSAKAGLEALRDLVLIPIALVAGFAGLLLSPRNPGIFFSRILDWGDRYDHFVDLFGSSKERRRAGLASVLPARRDPGPTADDVFEGIETMLVEQHERGGITAAAKETIDRALDVLQEAVEELVPERSGDAPRAEQRERAD